MYIYIYVYIDSQKPSIQESVWRQPRSAFLTTSQLTGLGKFQVDSGYAKGAIDFQRHKTFIEKKQWLHQYHQKF